MIKLLEGMIDGQGEGHIGWFPERQQKLTEIITSSKPSNLIEIGFNKGHSALLILNTISFLKKIDKEYSNKEINFLIFDICGYSYTEPNFEILKKYFSNINMELIKGSSLDTVKPYLEEKNIKFDFIEVDGLHTNEAVYQDILNTCQYINDNGIIYVDDYKSTKVPCDIDKGVEKFDWKSNGFNINTIDGLFWAKKLIK
jgi:predicted O-methyltransferase YrrM